MAEVKKFTQRIDGEDYPVLLIDSSADPIGDDELAVCEGCGQEVAVYFTTDLDATADAEQPGVSECLPCFFKGEWEKLSPR